MNLRQAAGEYLAAEVEGGDELHRVALLHQAAERLVRQAVRAVGDRDVEAAHTAFVKAKRIILHFLDNIPEHDDSDLAASLRGLYRWAYSQLAEANLRKDPRRAQTALDALKPISGAWRQLDHARPPAG